MKKSIVLILALAKRRAHLELQSSIITSAAAILDWKRQMVLKGQSRLQVTAAEIRAEMAIENRLPAILSAMRRIAREVPGCQIEGENSATTLWIEFDAGESRPDSDTNPWKLIEHRFRGRRPGRVEVLLLGVFSPDSSVAYDEFYGKLTADGAWTSILYPALLLLANDDALEGIPKSELASLLAKRFKLGFFDLVQSLELPQDKWDQFQKTGPTLEMLQAAKLNLAFDALDAWLNTPDSRDLRLILSSFGRGSSLPIDLRNRLDDWAEGVRSKYPHIQVDLYSLPAFGRLRMPLPEFAKLLHAKLMPSPELQAEVIVSDSFQVRLGKTYLTQSFINVPASKRELFPVDEEPFRYRICIDGHSFSSHGRANLRANPNHVARLMLGRAFSNFMKLHEVAVGTVMSFSFTRDKGGVSLLGEA